MRNSFPVIAVMLAAGAVFAAPQPNVRVVNAIGAPIQIEIANLVYDSNAVAGIQFTARNGGTDPVVSFHARVSFDGRGVARGFATRRFDVDLAPGQSTVLTAKLDKWFVERGHGLSIAVSQARTPAASWRLASSQATSEPVIGEWSQEAVASASSGCESNWCANERSACISMCHDGCVYSFKCSQAACESDCVCKTTPSCNP